MKKNLFCFLCLFLSACGGGGSSETLITPASSYAFINNTSLPANFDIQGHRGARGIKPENTLPAFETALDMGVSTLELDLHFSADKIVVIWHDDRLSANKCNPSSNALLSHLSLQELKAFSCSRNPDLLRFPFQNNSPTVLAGNNYQIQTLDELFNFVTRYANSPQKSLAQRNNAKQLKFNIETKRRANFPEGINDNFDGINPGEFELAILNIIERHHLENRVIIQSFDYRSLRAIYSVNSSIQLAAVSSNTNQPEQYTIFGANIWSPNYQHLTAALVNVAHNANLKVIPWTVNQPESMRKMIDWGVDGIITDRPDLLLLLNY